MNLQAVLAVRVKILLQPTVMVKRMRFKFSNSLLPLGIGLLELMLSIAIISGIVILSVRYYQSANISQQMSSASNMVSAVRAAMKNFHNDNGGNATNLPTIQNLVNGSYLPSGFQDGMGVNPWGGNIGIQDSSGADSCSSNEGSIGSTYTICLDNIPSASCTALSTKIASTLNLSGSQDVTGCSNDGTGSTINVVLQY